MLKIVYECIKIIKDKTGGKCSISSCDNFDGMRIQISKKLKDQELVHDCIFGREFLLNSNNQLLIEEFCYTFNSIYNSKIKEIFNEANRS